MQRHVITLDDDEKEQLLDIINTTDDAFVSLKREGTPVASIPQTEAIAAYRAILHNMRLKVERS